jgi:hypothetical protein
MTNATTEWYDVMFNITNIISNNYNNAMYDCYLFANSVSEQSIYWLGLFGNMTEVYTEFLLNLLANSL